MALPSDPATTPNLPQANSSSDTWDPVTTSNVIFSTIMVLIGIIAIWQAYRADRRRSLDEEQIVGGIQLLSQASSILSTASHNADVTIPLAQLSQSCSMSESHEQIQETTPAMADTMTLDATTTHSSL